MTHPEQPQRGGQTRLLLWREADNWVPWLTVWLRRRLRGGALARMRARDTSKFYIDDTDWLLLLESELRRGGIDQVAEGLAEEFTRHTLRSFHGCRTIDAGQYERGGLRAHNRAEQMAIVRRLVETDERLAPLRGQEIERRIADMDRRNQLDIGRCFVVLDDRALLERAAHYLIYGSEWICALLIDWRQPLLDLGSPTMICLDLPLSIVQDTTLIELARAFLLEYTRLVVRRSADVMVRDFSFLFRHDLPADFVVGHYHPAELVDPLQQMRRYRSRTTTCSACTVESKDPISLATLRTVTSARIWQG